MNLGAVFCVGNLTCSFHMLHTWPTQFYVGPPTLTFLATLVVGTELCRKVDLQEQGWAPLVYIVFNAVTSL